MTATVPRYFVPGYRVGRHGSPFAPVDWIAVERAIDGDHGGTLTTNELREAVLICQRRGLTSAETALRLRCSQRHVHRLRRAS